MKKYLLTGLAILLPFALTVFIILFLVDLITAPFVDLAQEITQSWLKNIVSIDDHKTLLLTISRICSIIFLFFAILLLGFFARRFLFDRIIHQFQRLFLRIPYVKNIYRILQEVTKGFIREENKKIFEATVSVPFPHLKARALAFLVGPAPANLPDPNITKAVFVPTAPHPISGFLILMDEKEIERVDGISTEEAFKILLSCGIYSPDAKKP